MSYNQAMKWAKKHPKGIRHNYFGFDAGTGRWPAPYCPKCKEHILECQCVTPLKKGEVK